MSEEQELSQSPVPSQRQQLPRKASISKEAREQAISPSKSVWPFALAVALMVLLMGFIIHPIIFGIGVVLVVAAIIGWGLEQR